MTASMILRNVLGRSVVAAAIGIVMADAALTKLNRRTGALARRALRRESYDALG